MTQSPYQPAPYKPAKRQPVQPALRTTRQGIEHHSSELLARVRVDLRPGKRQDRA